MLLPIFFYNSPLLLKLKRFQLGQQNIARVQVGVVLGCRLDWRQGEKSGSGLGLCGQRDRIEKRDINFFMNNWFLTVEITLATQKWLGDRVWNFLKNTVLEVGVTVGQLNLFLILCSPYACVPMVKKGCDSKIESEKEEDSFQILAGLICA